MAWSTLDVRIRLDRRARHRILHGQIYASFPTIRQWNSALTTPVYLLYALATGALFLNALIRGFGGAEQWCDVLVILSLIAAWAVKGSYWRGIDTARELHTVETATGLRSLGKVKLLDPPHSSDNYLMREMGFKVARKHARSLRRIANTFGLFVPLVATSVMTQAEGGLGILLALVALVCGMAGVAVERWLFFAEAKHTVQLYYGEESVGLRSRYLRQVCYKIDGWAFASLTRPGDLLRIFATHMTDRILIVDFGSDFDPKGVILSGGPASVHHTDTPRAPTASSIWDCRCSGSATVR